MTRTRTTCTRVRARADSRTCARVRARARAFAGARASRSCARSMCAGLHSTERDRACYSVRRKGAHYNLSIAGAGAGTRPRWFLA